MTTNPQRRTLIQSATLGVLAGTGFPATAA